MGISTDGLLVYGFPIDEKFFPEFEEPEYEGEKEFASAMHIAKAKNPLGYMAWHGMSYDGVRLIRHCSYDYPMYFASTHHKTAPRGRPLLIDMNSAVRSSYGVGLLAFAAKHNIKNPQIGWYLASMYG